VIRTDDVSLGRLLGDLDKWDLPEEAWRTVGVLLIAIAQAAGSGDQAALRRAVGDLEYCAPPRARTHPGPRCTKIPPELREQRNVLIRDLKLDLSVLPAKVEDRGGEAPAAGKP
jgi:hypothetical protein